MLSVGSFTGGAASSGFFTVAFFLALTFLALVFLADFFIFIFFLRAGLARLVLFVFFAFDFFRFFAMIVLPIGSQKRQSHKGRLRPSSNPPKSDSPGQRGERFGRRPSGCPVEQFDCVYNRDCG
ncbi:MAG: hypothetical protein WB475_03245, partial [Pseudolabrys sp.]